MKGALKRKARKCGDAHAQARGGFGENPNAGDTHKGGRLRVKGGGL